MELESVQQTLIQRNAFAPVVIMGKGNEASDLMGIVTVHDSLPLQQGKIIALAKANASKVRLEGEAVE